MGLGLRAQMMIQSGMLKSDHISGEPGRNGMKRGGEWGGMIKMLTAIER